MGKAEIMCVRLNVTINIELFMMVYSSIYHKEKKENGRERLNNVRGMLDRLLVELTSMRNN